MPLITETYYLSLTQDNRGILRLRCSQDDTLRTVNLKLYNNGSIFVIPSGVSASISGVKQNGAVFSKPCTISQDRESVVLQLSSDITNIDGIIVAEIVLNDGEGGRLGTSNFIIQVEKNPIRAGVIQDTETPIEYINDFIEKIQTLTARLNNLITPSGDASLAEVVDARIGILDSTTYQTLGARLNAEFQRLSNALNGVTTLESTGDTTDRTSEILSKLNAYGACKLGKGDFYVNGLVMPEDSMLMGSGKSTRVILPSAVTNGCIVKPRSNCIVENISFYGGFTGTYSELIASSDARRHCIILDKFNDVNSENVILSNIFISNFVGSAIVQRATNGCHCKDVVISMCYAGIDISNASYDGKCANVYISNTRLGVVQNGSNFVFSGCISKDSEYHITSDQQNTECTFSSCTFFDSSLETNSILAYLSNARNGFVFDNCMFDSSLIMGLNACDGIVIKGTNFVGSDTFTIAVYNSRNTLLLITDCIADVEPTVTNAGTAAHITSCYLKDGTAWSISESEVDITVDDELSDESENPVQNKVINRKISEIKADLEDLEDRVEDLEEGGGSGVPASVKSALASLFNAIPYTDDMTSEIAIIDSWASEISGISVSPTTASINGSSTTQLVATTTPAGGTVTWESSNTAVATVSSSGLVTGVGDGQATITARCGGYHASCAVTVSGSRTLTSISAVYSGGTVYDTATLNDLKSSLVVTANYDDSTTATVTDYTLSGTLAVGTSTITVSYGGKTTTFTVTVEAAPAEEEKWIDGLATGSIASFTYSPFVLPVTTYEYDYSKAITAIEGDFNVTGVISVGYYTGTVDTQSAPSTSETHIHEVLTVGATGQQKLALSTPMTIPSGTVLLIGQSTDTATFKYGGSLTNGFAYKDANSPNHFKFQSKKLGFNVYRR